MEENMVLRKKELKRLVKKVDIDKKGKVVTDNMIAGECRSLEEIIKEYSLAIELPFCKSGKSGKVNKIWRQIANFQRPGLPQTVSREAKTDYLNKISDFIRNDEPIKIVLVALPFKDPNPLVTNRIMPDLGELLFMERLLQIDKAVKTKYSLGVEITVLSEGKVYRNWLGVSETNIKYYMKGIKEFIDFLGGQNVIKIDCLKAVAESNQGFQKRRLENMERLKKQGYALDLFRPFEKVFYWSQNVSQFPFQDLVAVYYGHPQNWDSQQIEIHKTLKERAHKIAIEYLAFQMSKTKSIAESFPKHLYISITYKPERFCLGIPTLKPPHRGVTLLDIREARLFNLMDILIFQSRQPKVSAVYVDGYDKPTGPFYYEIS